MTCLFFASVLEVTQGAVSPPGWKRTLPAEQPEPRHLLGAWVGSGRAWRWCIGTTWVQILALPLDGYVEPWVCRLNSVCLSLLICKMGESKSK